MKPLLALAFAAAALAAPAATAGDEHWIVTGGGSAAGDQLEFGAISDVGGTDPHGHAEGQFTLFTSSFNDGGPIVCVTVLGHRAVLLWKLREPVTVPELPGVVFPYGGAYIEDNGPPAQGEPVDRVANYVVQERNAHFFCNADVANFFGAADAVPLDHGNFVVRGSA
jgi:hypothetical protein